MSGGGTDETAVERAGDEPARGSDARRRRRTRWIAVVAAASIALLVAVVIVVQQRPDAPVPVPSAAAEPPVTPTPTLTPTGPERDEWEYDIAALPVVDVFAILPALPVDDDPAGDTTGEVARPLPDGAPVFARPGDEPVAALPRELPYEGSIVPIVQREEHWLRVLLVGRSGVPSDGATGQLTGWLRVADVEISALDTRIEVSLSGGTIDIVTNGKRERVTELFAWGRSGTPTPIGRTFVMSVRTASSLAYTRGHPIVYLAVQSPTLDGFGGIDVAITAFHYHDVHDGPISNGCLRVDAAAIEKLTQVPAGTSVFVAE